MWVYSVQLIQLGTLQVQILMSYMQLTPTLSSAANATHTSLDGAQH